MSLRPIEMMFSGCSGWLIMVLPSPSFKEIEKSTFSPSVVHTSADFLPRVRILVLEAFKSKAMRDSCERILATVFMTSQPAYDTIALFSIIRPDSSAVISRYLCSL